MKKFILLATLTSSIFAATQGTLNLQGEITAVLDIAVTPTSDATDITLTSPQTVKVADVVERSNDADGYNVTITSANGGKLKNGTADEVIYTMTYGGAAVDLISGDNVVHANVVGEQTREVVLSHTNSRSEVDMAAGFYTDQVVFEIAAE